MTGSDPLDAPLLRELADLAPAMMWVTGPDNLCAWVNRACLEYTGRTLEQERGLGWAEFVHPDDRAACLAAVEDAFARRAPYELEYRVLRADGVYRWILDRARPRLAADGSFAGYVGTAFDVTERRNAQDATERSQARYQAIFDTALDGICVLDDAGWLIEVNAAMCRLLRGPADGLRGLTFLDLVPRERRDEAARLFEGLRATGSFAGEFPLLARDGTLVEIEWSSRASFSPGLHLCFAREIGARKRAERATHLLVQAGRLFSSTLDVDVALARLAEEAVAELAEAAWVFVASPSGPRCLAAVHRVPALHTTVHHHVARHEVPTFEAGRHAEPVLEAGDIDGLGEVRLLRIPLRASSVPRGELVLAGRGLGEPEMLLAEELARRVGDALEHARLLRESQGANRLKDEFLATLSHELRTPLNAIVGWSHVLQGGGVDDRTLVRAADIIARNAQSQVQLVSDLLDVSRIVAGKLRLLPRVADLRQTVEAAVDGVRPALEAREQRLDLRLDPAAGPLWGDADRLQQVAWNLLTNAVKFTPRGGRVSVSLVVDGDHLVLRVQDDGPGIDAAFLPFVFDRFRQADSSTTRSAGGLGLGMAIVRHLVEAHGGTVTCANRDDGPTGAVFTVRLPRNLPRVSASRAEQRLATAVSLGGIRVLVVDDEEDSREIVSTVLARQGAEVLSAASAAEAFDLVRTARPHVLVSDIQMAGEDGYALLRRLRALPADQGGLIPAAAVSAYAGHEHRAAALVAGFQAHLAKPVLPVELVAAVAGLAGRATA